MNLPGLFRNTRCTQALKALGLLLVGALAWGFLGEPQRLVVRRYQLQLSGWPRALGGLKLALLSDLHVGSPFWDLPALERLVERTNAEKPDLVLLAGDYLIGGVPGGTFVGPEPIAATLSRLRAPLGVVAVLGNHDWLNGGEGFRRAFATHRIALLEDRALPLEYRGTRFTVVGLSDRVMHPTDPRAALRGVEGPTLVLVHEPDVFESFPRLGLFPQLTLAGHTHGGQVRLPFLGRPVVPSDFGERYAYGHIVENGRHLFVTSGVGTSIMPVRFLVPPEVVIMILTAPQRRASP